MSRLGLFGFACAAVLSACGTARYVSRSQYGGTIALEGDRNKAMEAANQDMAGHCGGPTTYQIVQEGEVVVGTYTTEQDDVHTHHNGSTTTVEETTTHPTTEWRVTYQCAGAPAGSQSQIAPPPMAPPPQPAPPPPPDQGSGY